MKSIFISYSHADEHTRSELEKHLSTLRRQGIISLWHDRKISAGEVFANEISKYLEIADIIILIISSDFINSDYCYDIEMTRAFGRHRSGSAKVIPIIARACDWKNSPFAELQALPKDAKPISQWTDRDEAFFDIVLGIRAALGNRDAESIQIPSLSTVSRPSDSRSSPRSSNLRVRKEFTDLDRSKFLHEGFDYIHRFFENSLEELRLRNPEIQTEFRSIDRNTFSAQIFRNGRSISEARIGLGGFSDLNSIIFSAQIRSQSVNEMLAIEADEQNLFFKATLAFDSNQRRHLSFEGAAEYYWERFMTRVQ